MAIFITLAIDCGDNDEVARILAARFDDFELHISDASGKRQTERCSASAYQTRQAQPNDPQWHCVCVTQPVYFGGARNDLLDDEALAAIRHQLLEVLRGNAADVRGETTAATGFRAALFGQEAQDVLGEPDWPEQLEEIRQTDTPHYSYQGLILHQDLVAGQPVEGVLTPFSAGYVWWDAPPRKLSGNR